MPAYTVKLVVIGNEKVGKTKLCNLLTNTQSITKYVPTAGCRIIEYDTNIIGQSVDQQHSEEFEVTLEFWDLSGSMQYKNGWLATKKDCHGVIIVYDHTKMEISDIRQWFDHFVDKILDIRQCLIISINQQLPQIKADPKLKAIPCIACEYKENRLSATTRQEILQYIGVIFGYHPDAEFGVFEA